MIALLTALALTQRPGPAGGGPLDEGTLVVRLDTLEVARETFRLVSRRVGDSTSGWVLATTTRWFGGGAPVVFAPVLELTPDSQPGALAYDVNGNGASLRITGQPGPGRYTLRYVAPGREGARELPDGPRSVVVDDSVFAPYLFAAWQAGPSPTSVTAIFPRTARRTLLTVTDLGVTGTTLNRDPATLRHVLIAGGPDGPVHVWLTADSRLMKVEIPDRGWRAERLPS